MGLSLPPHREEPDLRGLPRDAPGDMRTGDTIDDIITL